MTELEVTGRRMLGMEAPPTSPQPVRVVSFRSQVGEHSFTFPKGHRFTESEDMIVVTYKDTTLTIYKAEVEDLSVEAKYTREDDREEER